MLKITPLPASQLRWGVSFYLPRPALAAQSAMALFGEVLP